MVLLYSQTYFKNQNVPNFLNILIVIYDNKKVFWNYLLCIQGHNHNRKDSFNAGANLMKILRVQQMLWSEKGKPLRLDVASHDLSQTNLIVA